MLDLSGRLDSVRVLQRSSSALKWLQPEPEGCGPSDLGGQLRVKQVSLATSLVKKRH